MFRLARDEREAFRRENDPCDRRRTGGMPATAAMAQRPAGSLALDAVADGAAQAAAFDSLSLHEFLRAVFLMRQFIG
jgi:hypothetical protein